MPCDSRPFRRLQTLKQRIDEVREVVDRFNKGLASGRVKAKVGPQGAVAFTGLTDEERGGVTDACAYRRLMVQGSALALQAIKRAEMLAGRAVDKQAVAIGAHSHDGGATWHEHKG